MLAFLDGPSVMRCAFTCKTMRTTCMDPDLWSGTLYNDFFTGYTGPAGALGELIRSVKDPQRMYREKMQRVADERAVQAVEAERATYLARLKTRSRDAAIRLGFCAWVVGTAAVPLGILGQLVLIVVILSIDYEIADGFGWVIVAPLCVSILGAALGWFSMCCTRISNGTMEDWEKIGQRAADRTSIVAYNKVDGWAKDVSTWAFDSLDEKRAFRHRRGCCGRCWRKQCSFSCCGFRRQPIRGDLTCCSRLTSTMLALAAAVCMVVFAVPALQGGWLVIRCCAGLAAGALLGFPSRSVSLTHTAIARIVPRCWFETPCADPNESWWPSAISFAVFCFMCSLIVVGLIMRQHYSESHHNHYYGYGRRRRARAKSSMVLCLGGILLPVQVILAVLHAESEDVGVSSGVMFIPTFIILLGTWCAGSQVDDDKVFFMCCGLIVSASLRVLESLGLTVCTPCGCHCRDGSGGVAVALRIVAPLTTCVHRVLGRPRPLPVPPLRPAACPQPCAAVIVTCVLFTLRLDGDTTYTWPAVLVPAIVALGMPLAACVLGSLCGWNDIVRTTRWENLQPPRVRTAATATAPIVLADGDWTDTDTDDDSMLDIVQRPWMDDDDLRIADIDDVPNLGARLMGARRAPRGRREFLRQLS